MIPLLMAALGGALGASGRYLAVRAVGADAAPWGTFAVNVAGSFALGVVAGLAAPAWSPEVRVFLVAGVLGGFTTFSAFSLDVAMLAEDGRWVLAAGYFAATPALCVAGLACGLALSRALSA